MAENILIDFVINDESLAPAIDQLEKLGLIDSKVATAFKQTNSEINKQAAAVKNVAAASVPLKKNLDDVAKAAKNTSNQFMIGFQEGIVETLKEAGVSLDEFEAAMAGTGDKIKPATQTVKAELRGLIEIIARAKAENQDYGEGYDALVQKAGRLKDAIGDVNQEIGNAGSDTRGLDNVLGTATAAAGAFSAVQGAAALFGAESEELQEVLLKVNAAMAIAQGLQVVTNSLQKEGAVTLLAMNIQRRISAATLIVENALQSQSVIVRGAAIVAQKALNFAMSLNPVGLFVAGLVTLILTIKSFISSAETATASLRKLNAEFERDVKGLEAYAETVKRNGDELLASMEARGAKSSELNRQTTQNLQEELRATIETESQYRDQYRQSIALLTDVANGRRKLNKDEVEQAETLVAGFESLQKRRVDLASQVRVQLIKNEKTIADEQKEAAEKAKQASEKAEAERKAARDALLRDRIAAIQLELLAVEQGSNAELVLQKRLIVAKANLELNAEKLTQNEIALIQQQSFTDREALQKAHDNKVRASAIDSEISKNNAVLSLLKTNDDERLLLQLSNIAFAAQKEIDLAEGNGAKIKEIIAKRDQEIRDTKIRFIREAVEYEIALETAKNGGLNRALENIVSNEKEKKDFRIAAANELFQIDLDTINQRQSALRKEKSQQLIGDKEYNLKYAQLQDQKVKLTQDKEKQITGIVLSEADKRRKAAEQTVALVLQIATDISGVLKGLADNQDAVDNARISNKRRELDEQLKAGQITEKEAIAREKRIDAEERRIKIQGAVRDKQLALFTAVINTAAGIAKASPVVPLMVLAAAVGAAQIAIIAARPIPQFGKGKKKGDKYEGPGYIGETGTELMEHNGKLYVTTKPTIVYLGPKDVVYNPMETKVMMNTTHKVDKQVMSYKEKIKSTPIDYDQMGKSVAKHTKGTSINIDKDFIRESVKDGLSIINHHSKYYKSP